MAEYLRWYDKDPVIKEFMSALERLDQETVSLLAQDFIQIMMEDAEINADGAEKITSFLLKKFFTINSKRTPRIQPLVRQKL